MTCTDDCRCADCENVNNINESNESSRDASDNDEEVNRFLFKEEMLQHIIIFNQYKYQIKLHIINMSIKMSIVSCI